MTVMVCSGFSPQGRQQYGERFLRSFDRHWPATIRLGVWVEEPMKMPRGACRDLWAIPGAREFHVEHAGNAAAQGRVPQPMWKETEVRRGYSFRHDAYKFWKQILIPAAAARELDDGDTLVWLDADVETFREVPERLVPDLLGRAEVAFLGRDRSHSEIGFWAVQINPATRLFLERIAQVYTSGAVFELPEWHSAFVWDHIRKQSGLTEHNLMPRFARGHVWPGSPLGRVTRHDKGRRKPQ